MATTLATVEQHDKGTDKVTELNLATNHPVRQQDLQQEALKVNFSPPGLAKSLKWQSKVRSNRKRSNRVGNTELETGNIENKSLKDKANQYQKQGSIKSW